MTELEKYKAMVDWLCLSVLSDENGFSECPYKCGHLDQQKICPLWTRYEGNKYHAALWFNKKRLTKKDFGAWARKVFHSNCGVVCAVKQQYHVNECWKFAAEYAVTGKEPRK